MKSHIAISTTSGRIVPLCHAHDGNVFSDSPTCKRCWKIQGKSMKDFHKEAMDKDELGRLKKGKEGGDVRY